MSWFFPFYLSRSILYFLCIVLCPRNCPLISSWVWPMKVMDRSEDGKRKRSEYFFSTQPCLDPVLAGVFFLYNTSIRQAPLCGSLSLWPLITSFPSSLGIIMASHCCKPWLLLHTSFIFLILATVQSPVEYTLFAARTLTKTTITQL